VIKIMKLTLFRKVKHIHLQFTLRTEGERVEAAAPFAAEPESFTSNPLCG
jgi:hypothetical protein